MSFCPRCGAAIDPKTSTRSCKFCGEHLLSDWLESESTNSLLPALPEQPEELTQIPKPDQCKPCAAPPPPIAPPLPQNSLAVEDLPPQLRAFATELEEWAVLNYRDARMDAIRFWGLKIPAIFSSASAGVLALMHLETVAAILAAMASACVLIDAVNPGGQLRNAHLRAVHDLRGLQHRMMNDWRIGKLRDKTGNCLAAEILESAEKTRSKIAVDLRVAETSFARSVNAK